MMYYDLNQEWELTLITCEKWRIYVGDVDAEIIQALDTKNKKTLLQNTKSILKKWNHQHFVDLVSEKELADILDLIIKKYESNTWV